MADLCPNWACKIDYTALFTALLFVATLGLWLATRRLVKGAEDTAIRQLRGYVSVSPNAMVFTLAQPLDIHAQSIRIQAICKNHGHTPVRNVRFRYEVQVLPHPLAECYQFEDARRIHSANDALAPGAQTETMFLRDQPLTLEELTNIRNDTARIYWWGVATYRDVFDRERYIEFCASVVGGSYFAQYVTEYIAAAAKGTALSLPPGMRNPFNWDYCDRHGHGD